MPARRISPGDEKRRRCRRCAGPGWFEPCCSASLYAGPHGMRPPATTSSVCRGLPVPCSARSPPEPALALCGDPAPTARQPGTGIHQASARRISQPRTAQTIRRVYCHDVRALGPQRRPDDLRLVIQVPLRHSGTRDPSVRQGEHLCAGHVDGLRFQGILRDRQVLAQQDILDERRLLNPLCVLDILRLTCAVTFVHGLKRPTRRSLDSGDDDRSEPAVKKEAQA